MMLLVASTSLTSFGQSLSSKVLLKERAKEIRAVQKRNAPEEEKKKKIKRIDSFYKELIQKAMDQEMAPTSPSNTNLPSKERKFGGDFSLPNIKGGSINITKTADAYATAVMAEANAKYMEACANAINSKEEFPGLLRNEDYRNVIFTIRGPGGSEITIQVSARGQEEVILPRGRYTVTTQIIQAGKTPSPPVTVTVGNPYKYGLYEGKKYSFVLTQPLSN